MRRAARVVLTIPCVLAAVACSDPANAGNGLRFCTEPAESTPAAEGIDPVAIDQFYRAAEGLPDLRSLLVVRHDLLVCEAYFRGYDVNYAFNVKSASKSMLSALVGIAIDEGVIPSLDTKISGYFPEYYPGQVDDPRKNDITVRQLLTMTGGWQWDETDGNLLVQWAFPNPNEFALGLPLANDPGSAFTYTTAGTHLLGTLLARAAGVDLREYAETRLLDPLGMTLQDWYRDPQGNYLGGSEMYFTARDMAKFGILFLNQGVHEGQQLVPLDWVGESTQFHVDAGGGWGYGYLWWLGEYAGYPAYQAWGAGGQFIIDVPAVDLVVVATSNVYSSQAYRESFFDLLGSVLIPGI